MLSIPNLASQQRATDGAAGSVLPLIFTFEF
jgi:hypothetical protein